MTDQERIEAKQAIAYQAAFFARNCMATLHDSGMPWESIIAGFHAETMIAMKLAFGGQMASDAGTSADKRVFTMPSMKDCWLYIVKPAGNA